MCGIMGYVGNKKKTINILYKGLESLEYRGYDSSGIAYIHNNELVIKKESGKLANLKKEIDMNTEASIGIGHTRWATHGIPNKINAHPHNCKDITIVHNGIIENYLEIKAELINLGYKFKSETDTEVAAVLLYDYYHKTSNMLEAIKLFKDRVEGSYAIAIICIKEIDTLYLIKKNSPLIIGLGKEENYIASDVPAILEYTNRYISLEDDAYAKITKDKINVYNKNGEEIEPKINTYDGDKNLASKHGYDHYMLKEIAEEANILRKYTEIPNFSFMKKYKRITIVGCGSAIYAGHVGKNLIEKYVGIPVDVIIASEFRYSPIFLDKKTLLIAISQSGETADTLEAVKIANNKKIDTLGIVNVRESSIARISKHVIYTLAGPEIAVATTKAYFNQVLVLSMMAYTLAKDKNQADIVNYLTDLHKLPIVIDNIFNNKKKYLNIAKKLYQHNDMFYIGRGIDYALSLEGSLKIKEISYLHSEAYPAGELKHGTISLIDDGVPVLGIVTDSGIAAKTISNIEEVKSRGAYVVYMTTDKLFKESNFYDETIIIKDVNNLLQPLVSIVPLQLVAYYTAKLNGCDIDKPKNLAKSVTVE